MGGRFRCILRLAILSIGLWGTYGVLLLRCRPCEAPMECCGYGADPMGHLRGALAAVPTLWGHL